MVLPFEIPVRMKYTRGQERVVARGTTETGVGRRNEHTGLIPSRSGSETPVVVVLTRDLLWLFQEERSDGEDGQRPPRPLSSGYDNETVDLRRRVVYDRPGTQ